MWCWLTRTMRYAFTLIYLSPSNARSSDKRCTTNSTKGANSIRMVTFRAEDGSYSSTIIFSLMKDMPAH